MKKPFTLQIEDQVRSDLASVAQAAHMDDTKFAAVWVRELSLLKPEFALKALGLIPDEWKKRRPGRPSSTTTRADSAAVDQLAAKDVA